MVAEEVLNALLPCRPVLPATLRLVREQLVTVLAQHEARCETVDLKLVRPSEGNAERLLATLADRLPHGPAELPVPVVADAHQPHTVAVVPASSDGGDGVVAPGPKREDPAGDAVPRPLVRRCQQRI